MKFRNKDVIEAIQYTGNNAAEIIKFISIDQNIIEYSISHPSLSLTIQLETNFQGPIYSTDWVYKINSPKNMIYIMTDEVMGLYWENITVEESNGNT